MYVQLGVLALFLQQRGSCGTEYTLAIQSSPGFVSQVTHGPKHGNRNSQEQLMDPSAVNLQGQVAVVTGAARGIGRAVAVYLARAGARVGLVDLPGHELADEALQVVQAAGGEALWLPADVSDAEAVQGAVQQAVQHWGRLDLVISNAAYSYRDLFHRVPLEEFHRTVDVTMWGAVYLLRAAAPVLIDQGRGGAMVVIGSPHAWLPIAQSMPYNMAKAALVQLVKTAAAELMEHRIRVNLVHPGWTDTPGERKFMSDEEIAQAAQLLPWQRLARPEEIARAVLFFCDPASEYITGTSLLVDGGVTLPWWIHREYALRKRIGYWEDVAARPQSQASTEAASDAEAGE